MKPSLIAFSLVTLNVFAGAQTESSVTQSDTIATARAKIGAERARLEAGFLEEDAACYKRFFVNSCLASVNSRRREAMANLRRQEISLNDEERRNRGAERIGKAEKNLSIENQQQAADRRASALDDYESRLDKEQNIRDEREKLQAGEKANREASTRRLRDQQEKVRSQAARQAAAAEEARKFNERQSQAQERRIQHDADQLKRSKSPAKSLPLPE